MIAKRESRKRYEVRRVDTEVSRVKLESRMKSRMKSGMKSGMKSRMNSSQG